MVGRKKLAEQTRGGFVPRPSDSFTDNPTLRRGCLEYKKMPDDAEKFGAIKTLLKAYQGEIDSLTRRSKMSETSFLNVYKLLSDAPDPYPLLDVAVDQTVKVAEAKMWESEMARLREENAELKKQAGETSQVDEKRKKAEAKAEQMEAKVGWQSCTRGISD